MICQDRSELLICEHLLDGAPCEVLLASDDKTDWALCLKCSLLDDPEDVPVVELCFSCAAQLGIPRSMPLSGRWCRLGAKESDA